MKNKSKFFWIYSIALFSVAFILILFSAFTGVRYKEEQYETKQLYQGAQTSVISLTDENEALEKENGEYSKKIDELTAENEKLKKKVDEMIDEKNYVIYQTENLLKAESLWKNKNYSEAKEMVNDIDTTVLSEYAMKKYEQLKKNLN